MAVDSIAEMLLAQLPQDVRERIDAQPRLEQALNDVLDEAARRWPGISLAPEEFLPFLGERLAMEPDPLSALATLRISASGGAALPAFVTLHLVHATRAELDRTIPLASVAPGHYSAPQAQLPEAGRWNVVVEDPDRHWRLVGTATGFDSPLRLGADRR